MKKIAFIFMIVGLLALGGQAFAELCTIDSVPAATLLLPYFEVNLDDPTGVNTLFSINNASAEPALAHVVFWTNWSAPTIDFDVFLTGYDVQTVSLYDVFVNGNLPRTATDIVDPTDTISPHGFNPAWDGDFTNCDSFFPYTNPIIGGTAADRLVNGHTGQGVTSLGGACLGANLGDNVARGYITIDNASECSLVLDSGEVGYFVNGGTGIANNENQLWGDYFIVDSANNFANADTLVHIEADASLDGVAAPPSGYTFYGRYTAAADPIGDDNREPLGTTWGVRYLNGGDFDGGTDLIVWRDSTADNLLPTGATCGNTAGAGPDWFPLNETQVVVFDEAEDAVEICFFAGGVISPPDSSDPACFPYESGRYQIGEAPLSIPFDFGWMYLNLNLPPDLPTGDVDFGTAGNLSQSYVSAIHDALGRFSVGLEAIELTSACSNDNPEIMGTIPLFDSGS